MKKALLGILGIVVLLTAGYVFLNITNGEKSAIAKDDTETGYGLISGEFLPCVWEAQTPERVQSENKTQAVTIGLKNETDETCETTLLLRAPGFNLSPNKEEQTVNLTASSSGSMSWILSPQKTGTFDIAVSDMINTKIFGISVTNTFGLSATQAKIASILGTLFGPMLTVPWWWDRLRKRKIETPKIT